MNSTPFARTRWLGSLVLLALGAGGPRAFAAFIAGSAVELNSVTEAGKVYDPIVMNGASAQVRADAGEVARIMFADLNDDLVYVEYSGAGQVVISLENLSGPAPLAKYNHGALFAKGLATIVVSGYDSQSKLVIYAAGAATVVDHSLLRNGVAYDGVADIRAVLLASVGASSFGELRSANARYAGSSGVVGISASTVTFTGPVSVQDITASNAGVPALLLGSATDVRVAGGSLFPINGEPLQVSGFSSLQSVSGTKADGTVLPLPTTIGTIKAAAGATLPSITAALPLAVTAGDFVSINVIGLLDTTTYSVTSGALPSWATLRSTDGALRGVPSTAGSPFTFTVTATGNSGTVLRENVTLTVNPPAAPSIATQPGSVAVTLGASTSLSVNASGTGVAYQWFRNGVAVSGATAATLVLPSVQLADVGSYSATATNEGGSVRSRAAVVGLAVTAKVTGAGTEVGTDIRHPSGNIYDQILLTGATATITADSGQVTRISFLDLNDDIVQVEFAGAGALTLSLANASGPATPVKYNQPTVSYMKGHASLVVTGANETTNLSVFSVGRANAVNQALFKDDVTYDGFADIAFVAIASSNGKFGGLRSANGSYFATSGQTGINAPGVQFTGPVFIGDVNASDQAAPVLLLGSGDDVRITGGDMLQANAASVEVSGITQLKFAPGTTSHGTLLPAQANRARFVQNGVDVTAQIVVFAP